VGARAAPASRGKNTSLPPAPAGPLLPIGQLARQSGTGVDTLRYYEKIGLLPPPPRSAGGQRLYPPAFARRLRFIRKARALGFPLEVIRELLALADGSLDSCAAAAERAARQLEAVRRQIAELTAMAGVLETLHAACTAGAGTPGPCPLIEALAGEEEGPGAAADPRPARAEGPAHGRSRGGRGGGSKGPGKSPGENFSMMISERNDDE
jgi:DNA-binding transcriptional MerR regulator